MMHTTHTIFRSATFALGVTLVLLCAATPAISQNSSIGIYTDESGTNCSLSGNNPGLVTAYVVVRPGPEGFRAIRFSAPVPTCFGGVFIDEGTPDQLPSIGDSQTGIAIASGVCEMRPRHVLTITYMRTSSTDPCCPYPVIPEIGFETIDAVTCNMEEMAYSGHVAHFNANETCECSASVEPFPATTPLPWDGDPRVVVTTEFSWLGSDYDGDVDEFDLYLGTSVDPPLVAAHLRETTYQPVEALEPSVHHFWRIVTRDSRGNETSSPTWEFVTRPVNSPPILPLLDRPVDGQETSRSTALGWEVSRDVDQDVVKYDVRLGTENPPPLVSRDQRETFWSTGTLLANTTYYWQIIARDAVGNESASEIRHFITNQPAALTTPYAPSPGKFQSRVPVTTSLRWKGNASSYRLYLGLAGSDLQMVAASLSSPSFDPPGDLVPDREYYWYVVANSSAGDLQGPVWWFSTGETQTNTPAGPASLMVGGSNSAALSWSVEQPSGDPLTYDVYFGQSQSPPLAGTTTEPSFTTGQLTPGVRYYWRVDTWDGENRAQGPEWSFQVPAIALGLQANYPNPFNPKTTIPYSLPTMMHVRVTIYDAAGRIVRVLVDEHQTTGNRSVVWNGDNEAGNTVASGVYFCVLRADEEIRMRKLVLLK